ncbi:MAG: DUF3794 domain-containing protein [Oscillospiraceae bacterium]|nr:DUF3794 domain-containing protein [Oscillospiraceae bacterium]
MDILFHAKSITYLAEKRYDGLRQEQTGEITIPETRPELGRVVDCFGTVLVQNRTADNGSVTVSGGIQTGVLYVPASGEGIERLELWIPFTVTKKIPIQPDAIVHYWGWLRSIDARFVNSRKLLIRADLGSELTVLTPTTLELQQLDSCPQGLVLKTETYPMRLPLCATEKEVRIADEVLMPEDGLGMDRLLKAQCWVEMGDRRVLGERAIFQGELKLRVMGLTEDGEIYTWTGGVPFSQYADLDSSMEEDSHLAIQPILNHVEIDTDGQPDSRRLLVNVSFTAQIVLWGDIPITLTQDAYALTGEFRPEWQSCELSASLDIMETDLSQTLELPPDAVKLLDLTLFQDQDPGGAEEARGSLSMNVLYYDADRSIQNKLLKRELRLERRADPSADWRWRLLPGEAKQQGGQLTVNLTAQQQFCQAKAMRNLSGGSLTPKTITEGPSLIVRTASGDLWEIARDHGSTVRAIQTANELEQLSLPEERLLLIPVGRGVITMEEVSE